MRRQRPVGIIPLISLIPLFLLHPLSSQAREGVVQAPHIFSWKKGETDGDYCTVCHTPHDSQTRPKPYWTNRIPSTTYSLYSRLPAATPDGLSKLCLSCHDGTIAPDSYSLRPFRASLFTTQGHPISVPYRFSPRRHLNDPRLTAIDPSTTIQDSLEEGKVQCSSCHEVHASKEKASGRFSQAGIRGNRGSLTEFCLVCHNI